MLSKPAFPHFYIIHSLLFILIKFLSPDLSEIHRGNQGIHLFTRLQFSLYSSDLFIPSM